MTFLNVLAYAEDSPPGRLLAEAAARLAKTYQAHLTGLFPRSSYLDAYSVSDGFGLAPSVAIQTLLEENAARINTEAAAARTAFVATAAAAGVEPSWLEVDGDADSSIITRARLADLVIFPASTPRTFGVSRRSASQLGLLSGSPMIVLPEAGYSPQLGQSVLIAWKDSREAARAVRDALPLLQRAGKVTILSVTDGDTDDTAALLQQYLAHHGCAAQIIVDRNMHETVGDRVRLQAQMTGSDMIVMGMYGHSRFQELILGGVSRELLTNPPMPLFLSH